MDFQFHALGHCVAQLWVNLQVVPPKGHTQTISNIFFAYAPHLDTVPQLNPEISSQAGSFPELTSSMFVLKKAIQAWGAPLRDTIPLSQLHTFADLIPRLSAKANPKLTKQTSIAYSTEFWPNKYFNKETYFALTLS